MPAGIIFSSILVIADGNAIVRKWKFWMTILKEIEFFDNL